MEDDAASRAEAEKRAAIMAVHRDATLSAAEKAQRIQFLMSGHYQGDPTDDVLKSSRQDVGVSYRPDSNGSVLGCRHYSRGCKIKAACCGGWYVCRRCHDDAVGSDHCIDRYATEEMLCMYCQQQQPIGKTCIACKKVLGVYYCDVCKFHDDDEDKNVYHCPFCKLCRVGQGLDIDFFHCVTCDACFHISLKDGGHECRKATLKQNCPVCHDDLFTSVKSVTRMPCGHWIHSGCLRKYARTNFVCPLCSKSIVDLDDAWLQLDALIAAQPMPPMYAEAKADFLCSDCLKHSMDAAFHFLGCKCVHCGSYNTKVTATRGLTSETQQADDESDEEANEE